MPGLRLRLAQHRPTEAPSWGGGVLCVIEKPGLACVVAKRSTKGSELAPKGPHRGTVATCEVGLFPV